MNVPLAKRRSESTTSAHDVPPKYPLRCTWESAVNPHMRILRRGVGSVSNERERRLILARGCAARSALAQGVNAGHYDRRSAEVTLDEVERVGI